jgi:uncharacterized protein (TIGR02145 family)
MHSQETNQDSIQVRAIELNKGCKLMLSDKIDINDTIAIEIIAKINLSLPKIQALIPTDSVIIVLEKGKQVISEWGIGARTNPSPDGTEIYIEYNEDNPNFKTDYIARALSHEFVHAVRLRAPRFSMTLLELIIQEGLGDHFMIEVFNCEPEPLSNALSEREVDNFLAILRPIIRQRLTSYNDFIPWAFGSKDSIPMWTAYSVGWRIVDNYLKAHPDTKPSQLILTNAEEIVKSTPELMFENGVRETLNPKTSIFQNYDILIDTRDSNEYKIIRIGNQSWMAENLIYSTSNNKREQFYNWVTACNVCSSGWHLPSDSEWQLLEKNLNMSQSDIENFGLRGHDIGNKLKSDNNWNYGGNGTNEFGFNALPLGYIFKSYGCFDTGYSTYFWTSSEFDKRNVWFRSFGYESGDIGRNIGSKNDFKFSVRCVKD